MKSLVDSTKCGVHATSSSSPADSDHQLCNYLSPMHYPDYHDGINSGSPGKKEPSSVLFLACFTKMASIFPGSGKDGSGSGSGSNAFDAIWSSIQKKSADDAAPAPYVHPLEKRSSISLSNKSLEICTESLGSETGAETMTFSQDSEIRNEKKPAVLASRSKRKVVAKASSLPPPLSSLGYRDEDGTGNVRMMCHRRGGRLVVEAVSVPSRSNRFKAERQGGRLLLTFSSDEDDFDADDQVSRDDYKFMVLTRWTNKVVPTPDETVAKKCWTPASKDPIPSTLTNEYMCSWRSKEMKTSYCDGKEQEAKPEVRNQ